MKIKHAIMNLFMIHLLILSFFLLFPKLVLSAQNVDEPTIIGWVDDTHFLIESKGIDGETVMERVNVRNGRSNPYVPPKTGFELLKEVLEPTIVISRADAFDENYSKVIAIRDGDLFYMDNRDKKLIRLTNDEAIEINARFSPDGRRVAYTKNNDLYYFDLEMNEEVRITFDSSERIYNGYAAWVYMEEILGRASNYAAFWWSPDGNKISFLRFDESDIPVFSLNRLEKSDGLHGMLEVIPYPKSGDPIPKVKMGIADLDMDTITWVDTDYSVDQYMAWPFWTTDSRNLAVQIVNREQNKLSIILADCGTGRTKEIYHEESGTWVEFREDIHVLEGGNGFIIRSYRDGWENLYYYDWTGEMVARLTDFDFRVTSIERIDGSDNTIFFYATGEESTDNHLYRVGLDGRSLVRITSGEGIHNVNISPKANYFLDSWSSVTDPGGIVAYDGRGRIIREIFDRDATGVRSGRELLKIETSDGLFQMPAIITYPENFDPDVKYPVIFRIYGGPDYKNVNNTWQESRSSWYAENGIIIFTVDHRGSGHFGRQGLDYLYRDLGHWEISDYSDAVKWLRELPYVDSTRIGITGSSYGGYLTCLALTKGAGYWTHGFAGSAVTDWRLYDNIYTERFMDRPVDNETGYNISSVLEYAGNLVGELYLNHGDIDDNVHMQNSLWLISRLQDEGKEFKFMIYPGQRHGFGGTKRIHSSNEERTFWLDSFFDR